MKTRKKLNHESVYQHFVSCCSEVGLDAVPFLDQMLTVDYVLANEDRHFSNFGLIRDPETLKFIKFAPIFDSGTSLCYNRNQRQFNNYTSKPFYEDYDRQIKLVTSFEWMDMNKASGVFKDIEQVLSASVTHGFISAERVQQLKSFVEMKLEYISNVASPVCQDCCMPDVNGYHGNSSGRAD